MPIAVTGKNQYGKCIYHSISYIIKCHYFNLNSREKVFTHYGNIYKIDGDSRDAKSHFG